MNNFLEILFRCDKLVEEAWRNRVSLLIGHSADREELGCDRIYFIVWNRELRKPVLALLDTRVHPSPPLFMGRWRRFFATIVCPNFCPRKFFDQRVSIKHLSISLSRSGGGGGNTRITWFNVDCNRAEIRNFLASISE